MVIHRLPHCSATYAVVPEPQVGLGDDWEVVEVPDVVQGVARARQAIRAAKLFHALPIGLPAALARGERTFGNRDWKHGRLTDAGGLGGRRTPTEHPPLDGN